MFGALFNAGEPPLAPRRLNGLIGDAYAVQHPFEPVQPAIQSVAVHLLVLFAILDQEVDPERALDVRVRALQRGPTPKHERFHWLTPPDRPYELTIADVVSGPTPQVRADSADRWIRHVWERWSVHRTTAEEWYRQFVYP